MFVNRLCGWGHIMKQCNVLQIPQKWPVLYDRPVGSHVGLSVDAKRSLHIYIDGRNEGVVAADIPDPSYFMFDLFSRCTQVGLLCRFR